MDVGLVLNRCVDEQIVIGDELVVITIVGVRAGRVRVGIRAPEHLEVHRREIFEKKKAEQNHEQEGSPGDDPI